MIRNNVKKQLIAKRIAYRQAKIKETFNRNCALIDEDITAIFTQNDDEETNEINEIYSALTINNLSYDR